MKAQKKTTKTMSAYRQVDELTGRLETVTVPAGSLVKDAPGVEWNSPVFGEPVAWFTVSLDGKTWTDIGVLNLPVLVRGWARQYVA